MSKIDHTMRKQDNIVFNKQRNNLEWLRFLVCALYWSELVHQRNLTDWMDGWIDEWMNGWMDGWRTRLQGIEDISLRADSNHRLSPVALKIKFRHKFCCCQRFISVPSSRIIAPSFIPLMQRNINERIQLLWGINCSIRGQTQEITNNWIRS